MKQFMRMKERSGTYKIRIQKQVGAELYQAQTKLGQAARKAEFFVCFRGLKQPLLAFAVA